jgi:hypothetical protein
MSEGKTPPPGAGSASDSPGEQRVRERSGAPMSAGGLEMRIDAALGEWPMVERSAIDWDEAADRIVDRIGNGERGHTAAYVSDEDLFAAPLAASTEEAQNSAAPVTVAATVGAKSAEGSKMGVQSERRERRSFQGLAEMARGSTPPPSSVGSVGSGMHRMDLPVPAPIIETKHKGDSGVLDLSTMAAADPAAAERAQTTPLASAELADELHAAAPAAVVASAQPAQPQAAQAQPAAPQKKGGGVVVLFGTVAAVAAIAAGAFFVIKAKSGDGNATATKLAAAPTTTVTQPAANAQRPTPAATATSTDNAVDPTALPLANANAPTATAPLGAPTGLLPFAPRPDPNAAASAPATPPTATTAEPAPVASAAAPAPSSSASLEEQMRQAAGPSTSAAPTPAPGTPNPTPGNIPMKPSQGAVSGALSAALPGARQCLGPDDPISQASVTFQSNGSVVSVTVTGGAAGKPQEACIKQALMRAKIAPFAQPTFIGYVTIRPN